MQTRSEGDPGESGPALHLQDLGEYALDPNLALYLPLWKRDCGPEPNNFFMSDDHYGHRFENHGSQWRLHGRYFDGVDDDIVTPEITLGGVPFTVLAWFRADTIPFPSHDVMESLHVDYSNKINIRGHGATRRMRCHYTIGGTHHTVHSPNILVAHTWSNIVQLMDGVDHKMFVDGVLVDEIPVTTVAALTAPIHIGCQAGTTRWWHGMVGEVAIFNRALTPLEIRNLYLGTKWRYQ